MKIKLLLTVPMTSWRYYFDAPKMVPRLCRPKTTLLHQMCAELLRERESNSLLYFGSVGRGEALEPLIPRSRRAPRLDTSLQHRVREAIQCGEALSFLYRPEDYATAFDHLLLVLDHLAAHTSRPRRGRVILAVDDARSMIPSLGPRAPQFGRLFGQAITRHPRLLPVFVCHELEDLSAAIRHEPRTTVLHTLRTLIFTPAMSHGGEDQLARLGCAPAAFSTRTINRGEYFSVDQVTGACNVHNFSQPQERGF